MSVPLYIPGYCLCILVSAAEKFTRQQICYVSWKFDHFFNFIVMSRLEFFKTICIYSSSGNIFNFLAVGMYCFLIVYGFLSHIDSKQRSCRLHKIGKWVLCYYFSYYQLILLSIVYKKIRNIFQLFCNLQSNKLKSNNLVLEW